MSELLTVAALDIRDGPEAVPGASVLATLDPRRYRRVGLALDRNEPGVLRDGALDAAVLLPPLDDPRFSGALVATILREKIRVVLPGSAPAATALTRAAPLLQPCGCGTPIRDAAPLEALAQVGVGDLCRRFGIPLGRFFELPNDDVLQTSVELPWPVLLIGADGRRVRAGDEWEVIHGRRELSSAGRVSAVPVDPTRLIEAFLVTDASQRLLGGAAARVLSDDSRQRPWMAVTVDNPELLEAAKRAVLALDLTGPVTLLLQWEGPAHQIIDVVPGFPLWIEVVLGGGPHLVERAVAAALGEAESVKPEFTPAGILFSQSFEDFVVDPDHPVLSKLESVV